MERVGGGSGGRIDGRWCEYLSVRGILSVTKINVLHFADIHIGMENYGHIDSGTGINSRVIDFLRRFDEVIDYGLSHDVDLVIFAGDAFKTRDPSPTLQREF